MMPIRLGKTWRQRKQSVLNDDNCKKSLSPDNATIELLKWIRTNSFRSKHLKPFDFPGTGRGLMATRSFQPGELVIKLPKKLMITTVTVLESYLGPIIKSCQPRLSPMQVLCLYIIAEQHRGKNSFWYPYIQVLPKHFSTPAFFNQDDINLLPQRLHPIALTQIDKVQDAFKGVQTCVCNIEEQFPELRGIFLYESFRWAWYVVNTRSVYMLQPKNPYLLSCETDHYALAPFLDLLNHSSDAQVSAGLNEKNDCYEIKTYTHYKKYQQVFINYGPHDNSTLLMEYGFTLPVNQHNVILFNIADLKKVSVDVGLADVKRKLDFLQDYNVIRDLSCSLNGLSWNLSTSLNILADNSHDRKTWKTFISGNGKSCDSEILKTLVKQLIIEVDSRIPKPKLINASCAPHKELIGTLVKDILEVVQYVNNIYVLNTS